jgi:hypothetical protein
MNRKTPAGLYPNIHVIVFDETDVCNFGENAQHIESLETVRFYDSKEALPTMISTIKHCRSLEHLIQILQTCNTTFQTR